MLYFGYGSNMNLAALCAWLVARVPNHPPRLDEPRLAILQDFRIRTNYLSLTHAAGAANIEPANGQKVEGVLLQIDTELRNLLRRKEGWPHNYQEHEVRVTAKGEQRKRRAFTFIVVPGRQFPRDLPVADAYRETILQAARELPLSPSYQRLLERVLVTV